MNRNKGHWWIGMQSIVKNPFDRRQIKIVFSSSSDYRGRKRDSDVVRAVSVGFEIHTFRTTKNTRKIYWRIFMVLYYYLWYTAAESFQSAISVCWSYSSNRLTGQQHRTEQRVLTHFIVRIYSAIVPCEKTNKNARPKQTEAVPKYGIRCAKINPRAAAIFRIGVDFYLIHSLCLHRTGTDENLIDECQGPS